MRTALVLNWLFWEMPLKTLVVPIKPFLLTVVDQNPICGAAGSST
jgi:hypothetical protein